jgi:hypothetical protein
VVRKNGENEVVERYMDERGFRKINEVSGVKIS